MRQLTALEAQKSGLPSITAPFGKICSIVQTEEMDKMYGTEFMAKSLTFVWELLGTKPYYGVDTESHGKMLKKLAILVNEEKMKSHLTKSLRLDLEGLREGHGLIEGGGSMGKVGLDVDVEAEGREGKAAFT